jgi:hypothetical protein
MPDPDASAAFDAIAAASGFQVNGLAKIPVEPFRISVTDGKKSWPGEGFSFLFVSSIIQNVGEWRKLHNE